MSGDKPTRKRTSKSEESNDETDTNSPSKKSRSPCDTPATSETGGSIRRATDTPASGAVKPTPKLRAILAQDEARPGTSRISDKTPSLDATDSSLESGSRSGSSGMSSPTIMGPPLSVDIRKRSKPKKKPPKSKRDLRPEDQPGPSRQDPDDSLGYGLESFAGNPSDNFFISDSPFNIQGYLAKTSPYAWGKILSDALILNSLEQNGPGSTSLLAEAAKLKAKADAEPDHVTRIKKYLRTAALYVVAADCLENREALPKESLKIYRNMKVLIDQAADLLTTPPRVDPRATQKKRLSVLCWKCKAWFRYRIYHLRLKLGLNDSSPSYRGPFYELVAPVERMTLDERPPTTDVPTKMFLNMKKEMEEFGVLHEAFRAWSTADSLIAAEAQQAFCRAVDSALGKSIHLMSKPNTVVRYIREYLARVERFKNVDRNPQGS